MLVAWILLAVGLVLIALNAVYVAAEFSLVTVDRVAVETAAAAGDKRARTVLSGLRRLSTQLSGAQIGITVTTLALGWVMEPSLAALIQGPLVAMGLPPTVASTVAITVSLLIATVLSMVFGELVPKNVAIALPMQVARAAIGINTVTTTAFKPLISVLNGTANATVRLMGFEPKEELGGARTAQELESLVRRSEAHGSLEAASARLVSQTLRFSTKLAVDVLTPRVDVVTVGVRDTANDVISVAATSGLSRFPVIDTDIDDVVGLVHVKRAVSVPVADRGEVHAGALMVPAPRVPGTVTLDDLMEQLRVRGLQMVIVADEYGGTEGIVTLEDVVEELLGDISDEHDVGTERWAATADGALSVNGSMRPDEIADETGLLLPEAAQYETVAGLITERLGRLPDLGDQVVVWSALRRGAVLSVTTADTDTDDAASDDFPRRAPVALTVSAMDGRRVLSVDIRIDMRVDGATDLRTRDDGDDSEQMG